MHMHQNLKNIDENFYRRQFSFYVNNNKEETRGKLPMKKDE